MGQSEGIDVTEQQQGNSKPGRLTLLCVHPHPDDESISCGGVLARYADAGRRTVVVTCTGGEEVDNLAGIDLGDEPLTSHRVRELEDALEVLGVEQHHWLGYRDSGMVGEASNGHPDSFHVADLEEAAHRLARIVRLEQPQVMVSDDAQGGYGHPDHIKANRVTIRALELAADPDAAIEGEPWLIAKRYVHTFGRGRLRIAHEAFLSAGVPSPFEQDDPVAGEDPPFGIEDALVTTEVDVMPWLERKRAAMAAHRSQIGGDSFFLNAPEDVVGILFGLEQFVLEHGPDPELRPETDLFAGLRPDPGGKDGR